VTLAGVHRGWFVAWVIDLVLVTAVLLAPGSLIAQSPSIFNVLGDKAQHFIAYATLAGFAIASFRTPRAAAVAAGAMVLHGMAMEFLQRAIALERAFEFGDMAADAAGVACGIVVAASLRRKHSGEKVRNEGADPESRRLHKGRSEPG
jgi:VanZ family protein